MPGDYVRIFDTTLRDGEQSPGATMTTAEKLEIARALARLGVDVIEAGFPAASPDDLAAVRAVAAEVGKRPSAPVVCGLARANARDIDLAWEALQPAARPRIHTFIATSDLHMRHKLRMTRDEVLARVAETVAHARSLCADVEFSAEDAGRSEPAFLARVVETAVRAGATTINIPDTVGYTTPDEFGALVGGVVACVPDDVVVSVHCHDDLGLATANTIAGLRAGARQAEVTINGIGERAGNCALEEVVMALHTRSPLHGLKTGVDTTQLVRTSRLVSTVTGFPVPPNKPIVGSNAFAHESGIHQDGMLKHSETYEIMQPETVGAGSTQLVLGKHSGRHAFATRLSELGYSLDDAALDDAFERFKRLAERKKHVTDAELEAVIEYGGCDSVQRDCWQLEDLQVSCGTLSLATASVRLRGPDGTTRVAAAVGTGPVDAAFRAIDALATSPGGGHTLVDYSVRSVTGGIDALAEVSVHVADGGASWRAHGADTDIVVASAKAYLGALNRMHRRVAREAAHAVR